VRVGTEQVPQPVQALRPVLMAMRLAMTVAIRMAMLVTVPVLMTVLVLVLVARPVTVAVARAGHFIHAFILREEVHFRTSAITMNAHMRNAGNNVLNPVGRGLRREPGSRGLDHGLAGARGPLPRARSARSSVRLAAGPAYWACRGGVEAAARHPCPPSLGRHRRTRDAAHQRCDPLPAC